MDVLDAATTVTLTDGPPARVIAAGATMQHPPENAPDALVIDLAEAVETDPLMLCRETARCSPATVIIGFGPEDRLADGFQLLRLGAASWVTRAPAEVLDDDAIAATLQGESFVAPRHAGWILADFATLSDKAPGPDPRFNATATEREVLTRLAKGQTPEEIAAFHDVETHLVNANVRMALGRLHRHR